MKKTIALLLFLCLAASLCACGSLDELYIHDAPAATPAPDAPAATPAPDDTPPVNVPELIGAPVVVGVERQSEQYAAPDDSGKIILTFSDDKARVKLDNAAAQEAINAFLLARDEEYYSGTSTGTGLNAILESAMDNYAFAVDKNKSINTEFSCARTVRIERADSRILSLTYRVTTYKEGIHSEIVDRSYVFDAETGALLTMDDLGPDRAALDAALLARMHELVDGDVLYKPLKEYMTDYLHVDPDEAFSALLREGSWVLTDKGLTVYSDPYEIGSYAEGSVRFTLGYDELEGLLDPNRFPTGRPAGGEAAVIGADEPGAADVRLLDSISVWDDVQRFIIFADGTIYDVSLTRVDYFNDAFYENRLVWHASYLSGSGVLVQAVVPEGMPNLMLRYLDENGVRHSYLVAQSGYDGSMLLLEESTVTAVG